MSALALPILFGFCCPTGGGLWAICPVRGKVAGGNWGTQGPLGKASQPRGIPGEEDPRPSTHCVTLKGRAASHCPSSRPSSQLFLSSLTALGDPSRLGSVSRMQTRQHKRLVLIPKRVPLWAPSRGNAASVLCIRRGHRPGGGDHAGGREPGSLLHKPGSSLGAPAGPGGEDTQPRSPETSQLCAGNCGHLEGGCRQLGRA